MSSRIYYFDALRGFALFGILLANLPVFSGLSMLPEAHQLESGLTFWLDVLIKAKFYSLFALLFGVSFILQQQGRSKQGFARHHKYRMLWLAAFGVLHMSIWFGDILLLYALLGLSLLWFNRLSDAALLVTALLMLLSPLLFYGVYLLLDFHDPLKSISATMKSDKPIYWAFMHGDWLEVFWLNLQFSAGRWCYIIINIRWPRVLGMFLLGMYLQRVGVFAYVTASLSGLSARLWLVLAAGLALALNLAYIELHNRDVFLPASGLGVLETLFAVIGVPLLALVYCACFLLLYKYRRLVFLESLGRMALSQYLLQSLVALLIFYPYGLALFAQFNSLQLLYLAVLMMLVLTAFAHIWFKYYRHGPCEYLWCWLLPKH